jgi:hypothetical protein
MGFAPSGNQIQNVPEPFPNPFITQNTTEPTTTEDAPGEQPPPSPQFPMVTFAPDEDEESAAPKPIHSEFWENSLMELVVAYEHEILSASPPEIISSRSTSADLPPSTIPRSDLPLDVAHPARRHPSWIPPIALTHPHGSVYGGSIPYSRRALRTEVADIMDAEGILTKGALTRRVRRDMEAARRELVRRMKARRDVLEANNRVKERIRVLEDEREEALSTVKKWRKRREARERGKREGRKAF